MLNSNKNSFLVHCNFNFFFLLCFCFVFCKSVFLLSGQFCECVSCDFLFDKYVGVAIKKNRFVKKLY